MEFGEGLGQGQAEAGSLVFSVEIAIDLLERGQRLGNVGQGDTDTGVGDLEYITVVPAKPDLDRHTAAGRRELDGIGQQVDQDLLELAFIGVQCRQGRWRVKVHMDTSLIGSFLDQGETRTEDP